MRFLHTMLRVKDLDRALHFFVDLLGLVEVRRMENEKGRFTLVFLATEPGAPEVELTFNWDQTEEYTHGRNFGHLAFRVKNVYEVCQRLLDAGVTINRPPRDGHMAFVRSPDNHSIEILQEGENLPAQAPWKDMPNTGSW